ncbi:hypothetical protein D1AOALGA4SA_5974 [Olavius algarvensis Delta 1 endosymbiont]|nr:hypothetical protein D1AOALGA4SA_5974 [Olavius algarvensis Delta 1 endosymbiont]
MFDILRFAFIFTCFIRARPLAEDRPVWSMIETIEWTHKRKNSHYISMIR